MHHASTVRAAIKAPLLALLIFFAIGLLATLTALRIPRQRTRMWLYRRCMQLTGMRLTTQGTFSPAPLLLVSNHCSYIDVILLGSLQDVAFTPKSEVRAWPVIGALVALFGAVFVERNPRKAKQVQAQIFDALKLHRPVSLFPEGTTNNGRTLFPFKPSLFSMAELWDGQEKLHIQPVTIRYDALNAAPMNDAAWDEVAWYGDIDFFPHLWNFLKQKRVDATIIFHAELLAESNKWDRKKLAASAHSVIAQSLNLQLPSIAHDHAA